MAIETFFSWSIVPMAFPHGLFPLGFFASMGAGSLGGGWSWGKSPIPVAAIVGDVTQHQLFIPCLTSNRTLFETEMAERHKVTCTILLTDEEEEHYSVSRVDSFFPP